MNGHRPFALGFAAFVAKRRKNLERTEGPFERAEGLLNLERAAGPFERPQALLPREFLSQREHVAAVHTLIVDGVHELAHQEDSQAANGAVFHR